ncbi:MAG: hypothetical protein ACLFNJ_11265 [Bacteroidales bacterium]
MSNKLNALLLSNKELLALNEALNHIYDHARWMMDVMENGEHLESAIEKVNENTGPIIRKEREL